MGHVPRLVVAFPSPYMFTLAASLASPLIIVLSKSHMSPGHGHIRQRRRGGLSGEAHDHLSSWVVWSWYNFAVLFLLALKCSPPRCLQQGQIELWSCSGMANPRLARTAITVAAQRRAC